MRLVTGLAIVALLVTGCSLVSPSRGPTSDREAPVRASAQPGWQTGETIASVAAKLIGTPYRFGGVTPSGFDCSGLVVYSHEQAGVAGVPRTVAEQSRAARPVPLGTMSPGDLIFFHLKARHVDHVGIYSGAGRFIHAPSSGGTVSYASLDDPYYRRHLAGAGRLWN
jgi:cell wall-associated NlpC family hydrolase